MPLAVTHVILTIVLVDLFRDYIMKNHKKYITLHTLFIAGVAGLLPDIDVAINMFFNIIGVQVSGFLQHGGIFHTPIFGLIFLIPGFILWNKKKHKAELKVAKRLTKYQRQLMNINARIKLIINNRQFSPEEKAKRIDKHLIRRQKLFEKAVSKVRAMTGEESIWTK